MPEVYAIGRLAREAGVNGETVRYYQRRGLLEEPRRPPGGIRRYSEVHARRLRFIKQAQALGFSLEEVKDLLALEDGRHCHEAERLASMKLAAVRESGCGSFVGSSKRSRLSSPAVNATRPKCAVRSSRRWKPTGPSLRGGVVISEASSPENNSLLWRLC